MNVWTKVELNQRLAELERRVRELEAENQALANRLAKAKRQAAETRRG